MRVKLKISYEVNAEPGKGETKADEERVDAAVSAAVGPFAMTVVEAAEAEGMDVTVSDDDDGDLSLAA
jgi:hypothetical protein